MASPTLLRRASRDSGPRSWP